MLFACIDGFVYFRPVRCSADKRPMAMQTAFALSFEPNTLRRH